MTAINDAQYFEALNKALKDLQEQKDNKEYLDYFDADANREAMIAIKRQIPLTPHYIGDGYSNGELVYDEWECPVCGEAYERVIERYDYCPNCGQRIKWEE